MNEKINALVGAKIKARRLQLGITQIELGEMIGVAENTIYSYERGIRKMNVDTFVELCKILYLKPEDVVHEVMKEINETR